MKKSTIAIIAVVILAVAVIAVVMFMGKKEEGQVVSKMQTTQEMQEMFNTIYTKIGEEFPSLETREIDVTDEQAVMAATGLKSANQVEAIVVSEPLMNAQAYSAVLVKVAKDANIEEMKQEMLNNIDTRKWICVSAEKVYVTNNGNVIFLVMSSEEWAKPVYDEFKNAVEGKIGKELQKTEEI